MAAADRGGQFEATEGHLGRGAIAMNGRTFTFDGMRTGRERESR
jgi:hypothetical protein